MGIYGRSYRGRIYNFEVVSIQGKVLNLVNIETFNKSKVNSDFIVCKDGLIQVGDIIQRQYTSEGVGIYNGGGVYSSEGNVSYTNISSQERWEAKHPLNSSLQKFSSVTGAGALALGFLFPPLGLLLVGIAGICLVLNTIAQIFSDNNKE